MLNTTEKYGWPRFIRDRHGMIFQAFDQPRPRIISWYDRPVVPWLASALACAVILAAWGVAGRTKGTTPPHATRPSDATLPAPAAERPVIAPDIGSAQPRLAMRAVTDPKRKLLYVNLWGEVGAHDGRRFRALITPYVQSGYLLHRVTISSLGGISEAAMDIGEQIRMLRSEVRAPFRDKQGDPHCVFKQATQSKVRPQGEGLADPDGFACLCASACSFIWASGFLRDGDAIGVHMFHFVGDGGPQWSRRDLQRRTALRVRELDGFLARMGMPAPIRAQMWATPPEKMYDLTPSEIATMTRDTAFASVRGANYKSVAEPLTRWEPLPPSNDPERSPCDQHTRLTMMRLGVARYLGRLDS